MGDFQRDYNLEAHDDTARFDLGNDIASWWKANRKIEEAWEDDASRLRTLNEYGIRNEQHYYQVSETVNRFICGVRIENAMQAGQEAYYAVCRELWIDNQAQVDRLRQTAYRYAPQPQQRAQFGYDMGDIAQMQMNALSSLQAEAHQARVQGEMAGELAPFKGVSLQTWANANAALAAGRDMNLILSKVGVDRATWDAVSAEWMARMSRDTTFTITTEYGKAFTNSGEGLFSDAAAKPAASGPPITLEQWVELMEAQSAAAQQGRDANQVLAHYGMNALAWSNASSWWSTHFSQNAMKNGGELHQRFSQLSDHFKQKFSTPSADGDISF